MLFRYIRHWIVTAAVIVLAAGTLQSQAGPLHEAVKSGNIDQVKQEVASGANVDAEDIFLGTPLIIAAIEGNAQIAEYLISQGASVNVQDNFNGTPLHAAARAGHIDVVEVLIGHGADIDIIRPSIGTTPLHSAAEGGHGKIIERLVAEGADINARSSDHYSPLHSAAKEGHFDIAELLTALGASSPSVEPIAKLLSSADPNEGRRLFSGHCIACHTAEEKRKPNQAGPYLRGVLDRKKASLSGFDYSEAFTRLSGYWDYDSLNAFIAGPRDAVPGTKMVIKGVKDASDRAHLIVYLRQFSDNPPPIPAR